MISLPFAIDVSPTARAIRSIRRGRLDFERLEALKSRLKTDIDAISTFHLHQLWRRAEKAHLGACSAKEAEILDFLMRRARWEVENRTMRVRHWR